MFGGNLGSFHSDVLSAEPADEDGKMRLVEEIKSRAKGSLSLKNYPEAIQLYSKAIELKPCDAVLFANRSMCHLQMSNGKEALSDAEKAIEFDNTYAKAYFRKGCAEVHLKYYKNAQITFEQGLAIAPGDKSFISQLDKLRTMSKDDTTKYVQTKSTPSKSSTVHKPASLKSEEPKSNISSAPTATTATDDDDKYDGGATSFRGYKKTADGRITTFFNNDLDEHTKALIGDIAPKKIDPNTASNDIPVSGAAESVWNKAGTWEERVHTPWAMVRLKELLEKVRIPITEHGGGSLYIKSATLTGDAQVTMARGKIKHIYDFSANGEWVLEMESGEDASGTFQIEDISGDREYEICTVVSKKGDEGSTAVINKYLKNSSQDNSFERVVTASLLAFHDEFLQK